MHLIWQFVVSGGFYAVPAGQWTWKPDPGPFADGTSGTQTGVIFDWRLFELRIDGPSDAEIASQGGRLEPFIDRTFETGPQVLGFAIDRLASVAKMFFHKVWAVAYA